MSKRILKTMKGKVNIVKYDIPLRHSMVRSSERPGKILVEAELQIGNHS